VTYVIALPCVDVKDRTCIDECPVDCIYEGERMLYINPDPWQDYYAANVEFFHEIGVPGGAARTGVLPFDHPLVAALPPQGD
jgi:hypothetical protein